MATFALVHGAWHGPWSWERVAGPLGEHGHEVVVPDLPSEDTELGLGDYADAIDRALGDATTSCWCRTRSGAWWGRLSPRGAR